jgi:sterol desaturase/sphingolipid hydroxylase (fatty acid hydroxylase superfamily)
MWHESAIFYVFIAALIVVPYVMAGLWYFLEKRNANYLNFKIYALPYEEGQLKRELKNSLWMPTHAVIALVFVKWFGTFSDTSFLGFCLSFWLTYIWAEVFHYYSHLVFHKPKFLWIHKEHHKSKVCSPFTALSFSFTEKFIFSICMFGLPALVDIFVDVNFYGVASWYLGYLVINSFAHANYEFKKPSFLARAGKSITSTSYHSLHHSRYVKNYGLGTRFLDQRHNTEWEDYEEVFMSARKGNPLTKLTQKLRSEKK